jgi:hypothetical protein
MQVRKKGETAPIGIGAQRGGTRHRLDDVEPPVPLLSAKRR